MAGFDGLDDETRDPIDEELDQGSRVVCALTILAHPDIDRVGERAVLGRGKRFDLSRKEPLFAPANGSGDSRPLADPFVSRKPTTITFDANGGAQLESESKVQIDGVRLSGSTKVTGAQLEDGVVIELQSRVAVLLHRTEEVRADPDDLGLVGEHPKMHRLRREIRRVAVLDVPILLRGRTGSGKELVARAVHATGPRADAACVALNMAAVQPSVAAAELFGHKKGAFTGAVDDRDGFFARADGGTLFLDEIGETPLEVQVMLLRTLETQTIQPVGAHDERSISVRLVAATDANLEDAVRAGSFRPALLHRLAGYEIFVPALAERREDIGRLLAHFYRADAEAVGAPERDAEGNRIWLPARVVARLARYDWPGNVRQLRNVVRKLAIAASDGTAALEAVVDRVMLEPVAPAPHSARAASTPSAAAPAEEEASRKPAEVEDDEIVAAMKKHGYRLERAAKELGISRASLYRRVEAHPNLRTAKDVSDDELRACYEELGGDLDKMSERLGVSVSGIRLRLKQL